MKKRNPIAVALLPLVTLGIYALYWFVKTKGEMNERGAQIPTAWLIIVPFVNIWWLWKYAEGVEHVTGSKLSTPLAFVILWLVELIGMAIVQDSFNNNVVVAQSTDPTSAAPVVAAVNSTMEPSPPQNTFTPPEPVASPETEAPNIPSAEQTTSQEPPEEPNQQPPAPQV